MSQDETPTPTLACSTQGPEPPPLPGPRVAAAFFDQRVSRDTLEWIRQCQEIAAWAAPGTPAAVSPQAAETVPPEPRKLVWDEPEPETEAPFNLWDHLPRVQPLFDQRVEPGLEWD